MTKLKLSDFKIETEKTGKIIETENGEKALEIVHIKNEKGTSVPKLIYTWSNYPKIRSALNSKLNAMKIELQKSIEEIDTNLTEEERKELIKSKKKEFNNNLRNAFENCKEKNHNSYKVIVRDTELIRIIRALNLKNNDTEENGYTYIKDLICVSVSVPMYKQIEKDGVIKVNHVRFKRILASSGNVRNKKVIFINEKLYDSAMTILLCGLPKDMEHEQVSKYNAYIGLVNSDTIPVSTPRMIVIDDFTTKIPETFDVVIKDKNKKFSVIPDQEKEFKLMPFDGAGIVDLEVAKIWSKELNDILRKETNRNKVNYIPSSFQFRAIIGVKGNLYTFDLKKYALSLDEDKRYIKDVWGKEHKILDDKDNLLIDAILTKSQFKFKKKYDSFDKWQTEFDKEVELKDLDNNDIKYKRTFNIAKWGNKKNKDKALLSYQPIQSLELTQEQIEILCKPTVEIIKNISTDVDEFLKYRGLLEETYDENGELVLKETDMDRVPKYYEALKKNKNLFYDSYIQKKVQKDINRFKENAMKGMVFVDGNFQTMSPDIIAFMEYATGQSVKGVVPKNNIYSNYWRNKEYISYEKNEAGEEVKKIEKVTAVDIIRFPHVSNEHIFATVMQNEIEEFQYIQDGIIMSIYDTSLERLGNGDEDGDRILTIPNVGAENKIIVDNAKEQQTNTIYFINEYEKDKKEKEEKLIAEGKMERPKPIKINQIDELIKCDANGMEASIGKVVNKISILWSLPKTKERDNYIKIMSVIGSLTIDYVKTGVLEPIPKEIEEFLENKKEVDGKEFKDSYKKPIFLKVKYKKLERDEKRINKNHKLFDDNITEELFSDTDCTMNRLYHHIESELNKINLDKPKGDFDFTTLIKDKANVRNETYPKVKEKLIELKKEHDDLTQENSIDIENYSYDSDKKVEQYDRFKYFYRYCKNELASINKETQKKDKLIDYLVYAFYCDKDFALKNEAKDLLWNVFGAELNTRINNKSYNDKEFDVIELEDKRKELLIEKKEKAKNNAKKIKIEGIDTLEDKDKKKIEFHKQNTFKNIDEMGLSKQANKVLKVLIMLDLLFNQYNKKLLIGQSSKKTITRATISKFTGINGIKIDEYLKELISKELIELTTKSDKITLECNINVSVSNTGNAVKLRDSESILKQLKK
ncbi:hypothetical protein B0H69_001485 [Clostridium beijerinckii]|jgi:hypothetical protein|nr:hypothetical protein [Clostridium beijerinckii]NRT67205.1 hypothetical protein [Clostridium beijerinckii]NRU52014.1 hypothetical protein [Clostridium beijerinckii]NRZ29847.1 hypothetical protein [Clostridium beijerinckii]NSA14421.1 hypothetical protein [Clostridium beijerinckii]NSA58883.1 hypothetical protein [Clostridium beijerinckii]